MYQSTQGLKGSISVGLNCELFLQFCREESGGGERSGDFPEVTQVGRSGGAPAPGWLSDSADCLGDAEGLRICSGSRGKQISGQWSED